MKGFKTLGGLGLCENQRKCISNMDTEYEQNPLLFPSRPDYFRFAVFEFLGNLSVESPSHGGPTRSPHLQTLDKGKLAGD